VLNNCNLQKLYLIRWTVLFHPINDVKEKGCDMMTVANKMKQTISGLKSAQASLETFALETDNQQAKQLFQQLATQTQGIVDGLNPRLQEIEQEEPQYKQ
jgi:hypothetical protein